MDDLKALVKLVSKQKVKNLDNLIWTNQNTKFTDLYDLIDQNKIDSDKEACMILYGVEKDQAYQKLRSRLTERLLNTVFFLDKKRSKFTDLKSHQLEIVKKYAIVRILRANKDKILHIKIAESILRKAIDIEYIEIAYLIAKILRQHYAYIDYNSSKYSKYRIISKDLEEELFAEVKTDEYYDFVSHAAAKGNKSINDDFKQEVTRISKELILFQKKFSSQRINYNAFQIRSYVFLLNTEFENCISLCDEARNFFSKKEIKNPFFDYVFNNDKFEALVSLERVEEARKVLEENLSLVSSPFNWFKIKRMALSLALFEKDYNQAYLICKEVVENPNFKKFKTINEQWKIRIAYIQLLLQAGYVDADLATENPLPKFNWNDILKTLPLYSKDKRGLNITIIVAQLIFLIINKKSIDILDRIDALNRYCSRYLKNNEDLRSNCFLKMISKLPEADFHPIRVERYVEKYKKRLLGTERILSQEISSTEIIAYEVLWDIILDYIGKNR